MKEYDKDLYIRDLEIVNNALIAEVQKAKKRIESNNERLVEKWRNRAKYFRSLLYKMREETRKETNDRNLSNSKQEKV